MVLDELVLALQRAIDRLVRRLRVGRAPRRDRRRLLIVQIDGLARSVLEHAIATGRMPFLARVLARGHHELVPMSVGLPTSTPAFQMAAMYGVPPDIPGFHYHDKRRRVDIYFPRAGDAAIVESEQARGRVGIVRGGSTYGCVFTGGADNNLFSFTMIKRPSGHGVLRGISAIVIVGWVTLKGAVLTAIEVSRALLRFVADPVSAGTQGWKWLAIKLGLSVWLREFFTLAVARDLYAGVPVIYVNYLDYDVVGHAYGPRHRRALRALRRVDGSLRQLWRAARRVPEYQYDIYVLSDHGQAPCTPFDRLHGGRRIEQQLLDDVFDPAGVRDVGPERPARRVASGIKGYLRGRAPGLFQRFVNYLEHDFPWRLGGVRAAGERAGVRVIAAGPNAFVYFVDTQEPLTIERIEKRYPGLGEELSRTVGIGLVFARSEAGPVCFHRGRRHRLGRTDPGPFAGRADLELVLAGVHDLMAMPSAGDLVLYGIEAAEGDVSFVGEVGAHAGPSESELHTFVVAPRGSGLRSPVRHPLELYPHFARYQEVEREAA